MPGYTSLVTELAALRTSSFIPKASIRRVRTAWYSLAWPLHDAIMALGTRDLSDPFAVLLCIREEAAGGCVFFWPFPRG